MPTGLFADLDDLVLQSIIHLDDEYPTDKKVLVWLETPLNPTGESRSIGACASAFRSSTRPSGTSLTPSLVADAKKAHAAGAILAIDSTFAPPPLQDPFKWGADIVMRPLVSSFLESSSSRPR